MTLHPVIKALASRPELLAEHAGAYLALASAEAAHAAAQWRLRATLLALAAACVALACGLAGVAALLAASLPSGDMPAPWALWLVPGAPLAAALLLWAWQRHIGVDTPFALLRGQLALDQALMRQVAAER